MTARVAAVIVNWRRPQDTVRAVRSLAAATVPVAAIVVDNGSGDESAAVLRSALPDAEILELTENLGFGGGANAGIRRAARRGFEFVLLLNNDTEVSAPDFVERLVVELDADPSIAAAGPRVRFPDGRVQPTIGRRPSFGYAIELAVAARTRPAGADPDAPTRVEFLNAVCLLVRTRVLEEVGGFDTRYFMYGEEADLAERMAALGYSLLYVPVDSIVHHHPDVTFDADAQLQMRTNFVRFCRDHRSTASAAAIAAWFLLAALARDARRRRLVELPRLAAALRGLLRRASNDDVAPELDDESAPRLE